MAVAGVTIDQVRTVMRDEVRSVVREEVTSALIEIKDGMSKILTMLEEDFRAESARLTKVDRRSAKTQKLLARHLRANAQSTRPS